MNMFIYFKLACLCCACFLWGCSAKHVKFADCGGVSLELKNIETIILPHDDGEFTAKFFYSVAQPDRLLYEFFFNNEFLNFGWIPVPGFPISIENIDYEEYAACTGPEKEDDFTFFFCKKGFFLHSYIKIV